MNREEAAANLVFFERQLLDIHPYTPPSAEMPYSVLLSFFDTEIPLWLQLGSRIRFFNEDQVETMLQQARFPIHRDLTTFAFDEDSNRIASGGSLDEEEASLTCLFRNHLLLTSELMGDVDAVYFLDMLHNPDPIWARMVNPNDMWLGSFSALCTGFARVLAHLEAISAISGAILEQKTLASRDQHSEPHADALFSLNRILGEFQAPRLGLDWFYTPRYFEFAGVAVGQSDIESFDEDRSIFQMMTQIFKTWLQNTPQFEFIGGREEQWWQAYVQRVREVRARPIVRRPSSA